VSSEKDNPKRRDNEQHDLKRQLSYPLIVDSCLVSFRHRKDGLACHEINEAWFITAITERPWTFVVIKCGD
jgi:hypothetical protein